MSRVNVKDHQRHPECFIQPWFTTQQQTCCWVSVGTLAILQIGDLWQDQRLEMRPDYQLERFERVAINPSTVHMVKAGHSHCQGVFLLPLNSHPWHRYNTHSYCVIVDLVGGRQLVIPCAELIRFYFGSSISLLSRLFLPPLERRALYSQAEYDKRSGRLFLELEHHISGASAADIGRMHLDRNA